LVEYRSPWHEGEFPALFHESESTTGQIHSTHQPPFDRVPNVHLDERLAQLASQLVARTQDLTSLQHHDRVDAKPNAIAIDIRKLLLDQPLLPACHSRTDVAPEAGVTDWQRRL